MIGKRGKPIRLALSGGVLILPILATKLPNPFAMSRQEHEKHTILKENSSTVNHINSLPIGFSNTGIAKQQHEACRGGNASTSPMVWNPT